MRATVTAGLAKLVELVNQYAAAMYPPINLAVALLAPDGLRPSIVNWKEVALHFLRGVAADAHADGMPETADLLKRLLEFPDVSALSDLTPQRESPVLPIHFRRDGTSLRLFTIIATLGTPREVTLVDIRIEFFFPMDEPTALAFRGWASRDPRGI